MAVAELTAQESRPTSFEGHLRLSELYSEWFEVVYCDTPDLIAEAHRLRHQVYCVETGFEDPADNPGGLEIDQYDERSVHSLLLHKPTQTFAGTVRLILPDPTLPDGGLPARALSKQLGALGEDGLPVGHTAEISRFAVSKEFRRRHYDELYPHGKPGSDAIDRELERRVLPNITLGLMRAVVAMGAPLGMTHVCALVEPALLVLLRRLGISFLTVPEMVAFHGSRRPVYRDFDSWSASIYQKNPDHWAVITDHGRHWPLVQPV